MKYRVILERTPHKDNCVWVDENRMRAQQRADSLSNLHGDCRVEWLDSEQMVIVRAGEWYRPRQGRMQ